MVRGYDARVLLASLLAVLLAASAVPPQARLEAALLESVAASCAGKVPKVDESLTQAARAFGQAVREGRAEASGDALSFFASLGTIDPSPYCGVGTVDPPPQADRAVGDLFPRSCRFDLVGVAAVAVSPTQAVVAVLTARRGAVLLPLPAQVEALEVVRFAGRLSDPALSAPRLYHLKPTGEVDDVPLVASKGEFALPVRLIETGAHALELLADGPGGPQVVALRRIFAGVAPPASPPPPLPPVEGDGLAAVERAIAALRHARGLPPLLRDAALDQVAEGHCKEMARLKTFAHVLPSDGSLGDRLVKAGYAYRSAGENLGLGEDAARAHEAVAQSPAHLFNLLDPRHRRVGLGAVRALSPEGLSAVWLTEVLALPVVGSKDPAGEVERVLQAERKKRNLSLLRRTAALDGMALKEIRHIAMAEAKILDTGAAQRALDADPELRSAATDLAVVGAPEDTVTSKNLGEPAWTKLGIGAIYASSEKYGPGRLWVLIVYAR